LDAFELGGISDNVDFLSALIQHHRFRSGAHTNDIIDEE
jgi:propionyl-CoA carboxylase alpha chain